MPKLSTGKRLPSYSPWACFFIFLAANTLLSYFPLSLETRLWIGLLGLFLPFLWAYLSPIPSARPNNFLDQREFLPSVPLGAWALVALLAVAARFTSLTSLFVWPNFDESSYGFDAYQLAGGVPPRFFYGVSQAPPLYVWGLGLFFKIFGTSLFTLRFFPALISLSAVPLAYAAARTYFSKSFSFLCALLTAGSFWPVFVGRFSLMTILILPMECLALLALGKFLKAPSEPAREKAAWGLGVVWGLGFYTHLHWPVVVVLTALPIVVWFWNHGKKGKAWGLTARLAGGTLGLSFPIFLAAAFQHYGGYLSHLWAFNGDFSWEKQLSVWASCLTSPFWGMDPNVHTYQPQWGGFLNPVLASLFFLGALEAVRHGQRPLYRWLAVGYFLCLLPGLLTQDMETFRLFPMVPILILVALLGFTNLLAAKPWKNLLLISGIFLCAMVLDSVHLFGFYHRIWNDPTSWGYYTKSVGRYRAFGILEKDWRQQGPGFIFPDFVQGLPDQSLSVATYSYNAALNPSLSLSEVRWAAILTNVNYKPFLQNRFPDGTAYALSKDFTEPDGGWMLFAFPLDEDRRKTLEGWCQAQNALESFEDVNLCYVMGRPFDRDLESLSSLEPSFRGDPFLQAAFYEKQADLETKQILLETGGKTTIPQAALGSITEPAVHSLEEALTEGYPAAHLYFHLGELWLMAQKPQEAQRAFHQALHAPLNLTDASRFLLTLSAPLHPGKFH